MNLHQHGRIKMFPNGIHETENRRLPDFVLGKVF